ncbi:MAG: hypothetical protein LBS69_02790 [Prevotellaceae bacterium]|jgi:hypothetical protein|nr:hypothetical protein [Prevotellaceae bacterium]
MKKKELFSLDEKLKKLEALTVTEKNRLTGGYADEEQDAAPKDYAFTAVFNPTGPSIKGGIVFKF